MKVEQLMTRNVQTCRAEDRLDQAAQIMWEHDCGVVPVVGGDGAARVVGMLTDRDICMAAYTQGRSLGDIPVGSAMSRQVCSLRPSDAIGVALKVMETNQVRRVPVVDQEDQVVGLLSIADLGREAQQEHKMKTAYITDATVGAAIEAISAPRACGTLVAAV
jgi:CBS-domain-containing membrane protein